jgi:hypothetical protein
VCNGQKISISSKYKTQQFNYNCDYLTDLNNDKITVNDLNLIFNKRDKY